MGESLYIAHCLHCLSIVCHSRMLVLPAPQAGKCEGIGPPGSGFSGSASAAQARLADYWHRLCLDHRDRQLRVL